MKTLQEFREELRLVRLEIEKLYWFQFPSEVEPGHIHRFKMTSGQAHSWNREQFDRLEHTERELNMAVRLLEYVEEVNSPEYKKRQVEFRRFSKELEERHKKDCTDPTCKRCHPPEFPELQNPFELDF